MVVQGHTTGSERERRLRLCSGRCNRFLAIRERRGGFGRPFQN